MKVLFKFKRQAKMLPTLNSYYYSTVRTRINLSCNKCHAIIKKNEPPSGHKVGFRKGFSAFISIYWVNYFEGVVSRL